MDATTTSRGRRRRRRRGGVCWRRRRRRRSTSSDAVSGAARRSARLRRLHGGKRSASLLNLQGGRGKRGGRRNFLDRSLRWPRSSSTTAVVCPWLVLLFWCSSRCILFVCRQDSAARHYGRYGPERQYSSCARRRFRHMQGWFC